MSRASNEPTHGVSVFHMDFHKNVMIPKLTAQKRTTCERLNCMLLGSTAQKRTKGRHMLGANARLRKIQKLLYPASIYIYVRQNPTIASGTYFGLITQGPRTRITRSFFILTISWRVDSVRESITSSSKQAIPLAP